MPDKEKIRTAILEATNTCSVKIGVCPSKVAKALEPDERLWRRNLTLIRREAVELAQEGKIDITRKGKIQDPFGEIKGILRFRKKQD